MAHSTRGSRRMQCREFPGEWGQDHGVLFERAITESHTDGSHAATHLGWGLIHVSLGLDTYPILA